MAGLRHGEWTVAVRWRRTRTRFHRHSRDARRPHRNDLEHPNQIWALSSNHSERRDPDAIAPSPIARRPDTQRKLSKRAPPSGLGNIDPLGADRSKSRPRAAVSAAIPAHNNAFVRTPLADFRSAPCGRYTAPHQRCPPRLRRSGAAQLPNVVCISRQLGKVVSALDNKLPIRWARLLDFRQRPASCRCRARLKPGATDGSLAGRG